MSTDPLSTLKRFLRSTNYPELVRSSSRARRPMLEHLVDAISGSSVWNASS